MLRITLILIAASALEWFGAPANARAQEQIAGCKLSKTLNMSGTKLAEEHWVMEGTADQPVQIDCDDMQFFADHMELFQKEGRVIANGNVTFIQAGNRIEAERMVYYTKTRTGTFFNATGTAVLRQSAQPGIFGTQEPDAFFWGEELHKVAPKTYRIVRGGFTTCVQPEPRWEMSSDSITMHLDEHVLLKNAVFKVKNVPLMFLPVFYYPIQEDNRATGFLIPMYGSTTQRGQSLTNQFFWAINRSNDATIEHDWFSKTGQQVGGEYRYVLGPGSQGSTRMSFLKEHPTTTNSGGSTVQTPGVQAFTLIGDMAQRLPYHMQARANANYYSNISTHQRYNQDVYQATNRSRRLNGNLTGAWSGFSLSVTADRTDSFVDETSYQTNGALPRIWLTRAEQAIGSTKMYFGVNSEYVTMVRSNTSNDVKVQDQGLSRFDVSPTLRIPFAKWPFFTVNSVAAWRGTYWTESLEKNASCPPESVVGPSCQVDEPIGRRYFDLQTRIVGPVFNRIWTPNNSYAEKFKHVIEPSLAIHYIPDITNFNEIVKLDGTDTVLGTTQFSYAVANRLYAKKKTSREIANVTLSQSYYTNENAATYDPSQPSGFGQTKPTHFGPVILAARGAPTDRLQADFRTDWDPNVHTFRTLSTNGSYSVADWLQTSVGWAHRRFIPGTIYTKESSTNSLNGSANVRRMGNRIGGFYSFNYDIKQTKFLQQRITGYYNAQCCGIALEYQTFDYTGSFVSRTVNVDHRLNISFTLAGIGTFSNLFGAFGGTQGR